MSLGGSIVVPGEIQIDFLKKFKDFILNFVKSGYKFVIVVGGGSTARRYQSAAGQISKISDKDKDLIGIQATLINAHLVRSIFKKQAYSEILKDPCKKIKEKFDIYVASGWVPGFSTDYDAVLLAKTYESNMIINASDIDYVYDKDIDKYKDAKPKEKLSWEEYKRIIGGKWIPGMNVPFDPMAAKAAQKLGIKVIVAKGTNLDNLEKIIKGEQFKGTILS